MKARAKCEICGLFTVVGFITDCGLICELCFSKELQIVAYNCAIKQAVENLRKHYLDNYAMLEDDQGALEDIIKAIEVLKKKEHKKVADDKHA